MGAGLLSESRSVYSAKLQPIVRCVSQKLFLRASAKQLLTLFKSDLDCLTLFAKTTGFSIQINISLIYID